MTGISRRSVVSVGIAGLLAAVLLYYSVRGIEWSLVAATAAHANPARLAFAAGLLTLTLYLRACRWRILLNAEGAVSVSTAFWATAAGYFGNNFLPARAGELVRTYMINARSGLGSAYVLATALSERAADAVVLVLVSALVLLALPEPPGWLAAAARPLAVIGLVAALALTAIPFLGPLGQAVIERAPLPHALRPRLIVLMEQGLLGIRAFHDTRRLLAFVGLTALIWCLDAFGAIVTASALGLRISVSASFLLMAGLGLGSALPSTPGYVGIYQFVAVTVLTPFGFTRTAAITYILVAQVVSYMVIAFWGALGLLVYRRTRRSI